MIRDAKIMQEKVANSQLARKSKTVQRHREAQFYISITGANAIKNIIIRLKQHEQLDGQVETFNRERTKQKQKMLKL